MRFLTGPFQDAFRATVGIEGGYVDDPNDHGGETKFGISKRSYPDLDIKSLTIDQARAIYYRDFWRPLLLDDLIDPQIAGEIFDTAVNCGMGSAVRIAQKALKFLGEPIDADGKMGPLTVERLNKWSRKDPNALFKALNGYQFIRYVAIIESDPDQKRYSHGWLRRIQGYRSA